VCGQKAVLIYQTIWPLTVSCRLVFPGTTGPSGYATLYSLRLLGYQKRWLGDRKVCVGKRQF
jgi:hypothetical protein